MTARPTVPHDCPHCHAKATVVKPSGAWRLALAAGYGVLLAMGLGMGVMGVAGPGLVLPFIVVYALGTLPFLHDKASAPATCTACDRIVEATAPDAVRRRTHEARVLLHGA